MTEHELAARCKAGDREAQRELYSQTSARVYRLLFRITGNQDTALDLAQDTYIKAFAHIDQFDHRSAIATWLYRIAVTEALQYLRREKRFRGSLQDDLTEPTIDSYSEQTVTKLDINDALSSLDPGDRAILLLRYQEGQNYRSIAETLHCEEGTVASRLNRARKRIRKILGKNYIEREEIVGTKHQINRGTDHAAKQAESEKQPFITEEEGDES